jgi:hypothetical protein
MKFVTSLWNKANGKKTWFGVFCAVVYTGLVAQGIITRNEMIELAIFTVTGVGVGHKVVKS